MAPGGHYIDVTVPITNSLPVWPGDPPVRVRPAARIAAGDTVNTSRLELGNHTGTHVDAPLHYLPDGATLDAVPLDVLVGPSWLADLTHVDRHIEAGDLAAAAIPPGTRRLLLKTRNSQIWAAHPDEFLRDFVALTPDAAHWVVQAGIALVGIDYLSIEPFDGSGDTHRILLRAGVVVLEGLDLRVPLPGAYCLACLPLKLASLDGAPCRAILGPPTEEV